MDKKTNIIMNELPTLLISNLKKKLVLISSDNKKSYCSFWSDGRKRTLVYLMWDVVVNPNLVLFLCIHDVLSCLTIHDLLARAALIIPAYSVGLGRLGSNYWVSLESANSSSWTMTNFFGISGDLVHWRHYTKLWKINKYAKNQQLRFLIPYLTLSWHICRL